MCVNYYLVIVNESHNPKSVPFVKSGLVLVEVPENDGDSFFDGFAASSDIFVHFWLKDWIIQKLKTMLSTLCRLVKGNSLGNCDLHNTGNEFSLIR